MSPETTDDVHWAIEEERETLEEDYDGEMPGMEPPDWVKRIRELSVLASKEPFGSASYGTWSQEYYNLYLDQLHVVGTVGLAPTIMVSRTNLRNLPTHYPLWAEYPGNLNWYAQGFFYE